MNGPLDCSRHGRGKETKRPGVPQKLVNLCQNETEGEHVSLAELGTLLGPGS